MIIIQTHWSKPLRWQNQNKRIRDQLLMYGLSAHTCRKAFNVPVYMITDSPFASILADFPDMYDGVSTELDDLIGVNPQFWAFPKFHVFAKYGGSNTLLLQIDTDVFFWDEMQIGSHVDLIAQSIEDKGIFDHSYDLPVKFVDRCIKQSGRTIPYWSPNLKSALNCGVVGFKDGNLAKEYALNAINICDAVEPYLDQFSEIPDGKRNGSVMVIPEQYYLQCFAKGLNLHTAFVSAKRLADGTVASFHPFDYYHMMGDKTDQVMRDMVADKARNMIPEFYNKLADSAYSGF
ncbi:MAG: hypothetical protein EBT07_04670 [Actinobacteria bacterium]|nr:hypothetical protein [Actinomycetota bacterium]